MRFETTRVGSGGGGRGPGHSFAGGGKVWLRAAKTVDDNLGILFLLATIEQKPELVYDDALMEGPQLLGYCFEEQCEGVL